MLELGEGLPTYRPPLSYARIFGDQGDSGSGRPEVTLRYLTPHSKWSIHSEYQDNLHMLTLFRGGPVIWMSREDAERIGVHDNDWIEALQPQRRGRLPGRGHAPRAPGHLPHVPRQGPPPEQPAHRAATASAAAPTTR